MRRHLAIALATPLIVARLAAQDTTTHHRRYDLVTDAQDRNGIRLNPEWGTKAPRDGLDPIEECGLLALGERPGFRRPLVKNRWCLEPEQRHRLRLNEGRSMRVFGGGCSQTEEDGSIQGHINWSPVTMVGTLRYHDTSDKRSQEYFDHDHTFDFFRDSMLPATKYNSFVSLSGAAPVPTIHVELDTRETSERVDQSRPNWWTRLATLAKEDRHWVGDSLIGLGQIAITGIFGLDAVHGGHAEIHPVFAMAILRNRVINPAGTSREDEWVFVARDRGGEGNCASGVIPLVTSTTPAGRDTFRLQLGEPDTSSVRPEVGLASWVAASLGDSIVPNPVVAWRTGHGAELVFTWPRPTPGSPDATVLGVLFLRWAATHDAEPLKPASSQWVETKSKRESHRRWRGNPPDEEWYYNSLSRRPIRLRPGWPSERDTVVAANEVPRRPPDGLPGMMHFAVVPETALCGNTTDTLAQEADRGLNSRCVGRNTFELGGALEVRSARFQATKG